MLQLIGLFTEEPHSPTIIANRAQMSLTKGPVKFARFAKRRGKMGPHFPPPQPPKKRHRQISNPLSRPVLSPKRGTWTPMQLSMETYRLHSGVSRV